MNQYRTKDGDMVDQICRDHYGSEAQTEKVYDANPGLAAHGPILPMGLLITLPEVAPPPVRNPIRLWGSET